MMFFLSIAVLTAALLLGGGSRAGFIGDVCVQLLAIPLILASLWRWPRESDALSPQRRSPDLPLVLIALLALVALVVQFLPLRPLGSDWLWLNGVPLQAGDALANQSWRGISLTPTASWAAVASLLPPLALFAGVSQLDAAARFRMAALVIGLGALGLLLGFLQIAQGPQSGLRLFEFTNPTEAVGLFANRNHFVAQLYTALVFSAVWFSLAAKNFVKHGTLDTRAILAFAAAAVLLIATVAGLALARSRAGLFLTLVAIAGIVAMFFVDGRASRDGRNPSRRFVQRLTLAALGIALVFAVQFGLHRMMTRFEVDPIGDLRVTLTSTTLQAALESLPFGTGLGSFVSVYATKESAQDLFSGYANRAHNDWVEFLLETGVFGAAIAALFLWWFATKSVGIWRARPADERDHHRMLQRAATVVIVLLLAHSLIDYPLRTTAMAAVFAFACAILIEPPRPATPSEPPQGQRRKRRRTARPAAPTEATPQPGWEADDVDWPEAWKTRGT